MSRRDVVFDIQDGEPSLNMVEFWRTRMKTRPFIKWAGGKGHLLPYFSPFFPSMEKGSRYFEPFIGSAAVFFSLQPPHALLSDSNAELIQLYQVVQQDVENLILALQKHDNKKEYYYQVRALDPATLPPVERAARLIFLNKTCYNGLYRVNRKGQFNVPFGRYRNPPICDPDGLRAASLALQSAELRMADFEEAVSTARGLDFIYFDPPYQPISKTSSFTGYTAGKFDDAEQKRLAAVFRDLHQRGCYVMLSNSNAPLVRELYADFQITEIKANRAINSRPDGRGKITECLITNYSGNMIR